MKHDLLLLVITQLLTCCVPRSIKMTNCRVAMTDGIVGSVELKRTGFVSDAIM